MSQKWLLRGKQFNTRFCICRNIVGSNCVKRVYRETNYQKIIVRSVDGKVAWLLWITVAFETLWYYFIHMDLHINIYIYIVICSTQRNYYGSHGDVISSRNVKWNSDLLIPFETLKLEPVIIKYSLLQPGTCYKNSIMRTLIYRSKRNNGKRFSVICLHTEGHTQLSRNHLAEC